MAVATAAPPPGVSAQDVQILKYENIIDSRGNYKFVFEQSDGTKYEERSELKNEGSEDDTIAIKGTFSWIAPDGTRYIVNYVADENGYQPELEEGPGMVPSHLKDSLLGK